MGGSNPSGRVELKDSVFAIRAGPQQPPRRLSNSMFQLASGGSPGTYLEAFYSNALLLSAESFANLPTWQEIIEGAFPPPSQPFENEPDVARKGWQQEACKVREKHDFDLFLQSVPPKSQARIRSRGGPNAGT